MIVKCGTRDRGLVSQQASVCSTLLAKTSHDFNFGQKKRVQKYSLNSYASDRKELNF